MWNDVKDKLPDSTQHVLVLCSEYIKIGFYCSECEKWFHEEDERELNNVEKWSSISDPFEE